MSFPTLIPTSPVNVAPPVATQTTSAIEVRSVGFDLGQKTFTIVYGAPGAQPRTVTGAIPAALLASLLQKAQSAIEADLSIAGTTVTP